MIPENSTFGQSDIVRLNDEDAAVKLLERAVTRLWEVANDLNRFRRTTRQNYRVTIFGSARLKLETPADDGVRRLAAALSTMDCDILTGGGPGLMQAANERAHSVDPRGLRRSARITNKLPFEQAVNPFVTRALTHRTFFPRLRHIMIVSDVFIVAPGGIGSLSPSLPLAGCGVPLPCPMPRNVRVNQRNNNRSLFGEQP